MAVMNTESERPAERRSRYPKEFRRNAAALVIDQHRTVVDVAKGTRRRRTDPGQLGAPGARRPRREGGPLEAHDFHGEWNYHRRSINLGVSPKT